MYQEPIQYTTTILPKSDPILVHRLQELCDGVGKNRRLALHHSATELLGKRGSSTYFKKREHHIFYFVLWNTLNLGLNLNHIKCTSYGSSAVSTHFSTPFTCIHRNISNLWWLCCVQKHSFQETFGFYGALKRGISCLQDNQHAMCTAHKSIHFHWVYTSMSAITFTLFQYSAVSSGAFL